MNKKLSDLILSTQSNLVINSELAVKIGLNEAIVLRQIYYWLEINEKLKRNYYDGKYWSYNTMENWRKENFPWWSTKTVERAFKNLVNSGLVITGNYNKDSRDRTKWYSIDEDVLEKILKDTVEISTSDCPCANRQNDEMHTDNSTEALPETTYREHYTENTDKDFILSNKEKKTLSKNYKGSKTSATNNINILNINNIPSRTTEQKEVYRKQKQKNRSEKYRDEDVPQILYNKFNSLYGEQENILEDHDICLTMAVIAYYFKQYRERMDEQHIMISAEYADQFMGVIIGDDSPLLKADVEEKDELRFYQDMIDEFFKSDLGQRNGKDFDRHIWLFFSERNQDILCERVKQKWDDQEYID